MRLLFLTFGALCVLLALIAVSHVVWLPDILSSKEVYLSTLKTQSGDRFAITQEFVGDGYSTCFSHTNKVGRSWRVVVDGDARKAWKGSIVMRDMTHFEFKVLGQEFVYDVNSHTVMDKEGGHRFMLEIPEDGAPAFLRGK
jgi:hypothetical protein